LQAGERILDRDQRDSNREQFFDTVMSDQRSGRTICLRIGNERVSIEVLSLDRDKQITTRRLP
jgi:hypothetical protein